MKVLGILMMVAGVVFGVWAGLWWAFIGGISQIVDALQASPIDGSNIGWGVVKIIFAGAIGGICGFLLIVPGAALAARL
jgi:hypothetical protein